MNFTNQPQRATAWPTPPTNSGTYAFVDLDSQVVWQNLRVIDNPAAPGTDDLYDAAEAIAATLDPANAEPVSWEQVKRDLKL